MLLGNFTLSGLCQTEDRFLKCNAPCDSAMPFPSPLSLVYSPMCLYRPNYTRIDLAK